MAWTKAKTAAVAGAVLILTAGTTTMIVKNYGHHPKVKLQWTPAEKESFQQESIARMNQAKLSALACIMFAGDHGNQLPQNFEQLKTYASGSASSNHGQELFGAMKQLKTNTNGLSSSNWEIVSGGSENSIANPSRTILLREKESRPSPNGQFARVYAFADGHVEVVSSPDDNFAALEKERGYLVHPAKN